MINLMSSCLMCKKPAIPSGCYVSWSGWSGCPPWQTKLPGIWLDFSASCISDVLGWRSDFSKSVVVPWSPNDTPSLQTCTHPGLQFLQAEGQITATRDCHQGHKLRQCHCRGRWDHPLSMLKLSLTLRTRGNQQRFARVIFINLLEHMEPV